MSNTIELGLNLDEALYVKSAIVATLKKQNKEELGIFWPNADIPNVIRQLEVIIDVLFTEGKE